MACTFSEVKELILVFSNLLQHFLYNLKSCMTVKRSTFTKLLWIHLSCLTERRCKNHRAFTSHPECTACFWRTCFSCFWNIPATTQTRGKNTTCSVYKVIFFIISVP